MYTRDSGVRVVARGGGAGGWSVDIKRIAQVGRGETLCSGNNIRVNRGRGLFAPYC